MIIDPTTLSTQLDMLEDIEKATLRYVLTALFEYRLDALQIFKEETDLVADIAEDVTREAMDKIGLCRVDQRLYGKVDYKKACYFFSPEFAVKQALFIDSKAEKPSGQNTATLQMTQLSMAVLQNRSGNLINEQGKLPSVIDIKGDKFLTTTIFVKYTYDDISGYNKLKTITIASLPNGMLQSRYNPNANDTIFIAGRNAPSRGEEFRVRLSFSRLTNKSLWRVQKINPTDSNINWVQ